MVDRDPYIQAQIDSRQRSAVVKIRFLNFRSKYPEGLVLAVEGDDDKIVFSYWIAKVDPDLQYEFFPCGGKRSVRKLVNSLNSHLSDADALDNVLFFVDRDFDDLQGFDTSNHVFMLEKYSVENYLVNPAVLRDVVRIAFPGAIDARCRYRISDMFFEDYCDFLSCTLEVNARIFVARNLGIDIDNIIPASINNFVSVDLANVISKGALASELVPFPAEPDAGEYVSLMKDFMSLDRADRYRGKYAYKFLRVWLDKLASEFRNPCLNIFEIEEQSQGKVKPDELSMGSFAMWSSILEGLPEFLRKDRCRPVDVA